MGKRIAIVTIYHNNFNYGAALQAYALQQSIMGLGVECEILDIEFDAGASNQEAKHENCGVLKRVYRIIKRIQNEVLYHRQIMQLADRCNAIQIFKDTYIQHTSTLCEEDLEKIADSYDAFICGSDQIWNPRYWHSAYFLNFVKERQKISYAASIGVASYTHEQQCRVFAHLQDFDAISVREKEGVELLRQIGIKNAVQMVDPTFLMRHEEWDGICTERIVDGHYILGCFLGNSLQYRRLVENASRQFNLMLVMLSTGREETKLNHGVGDLEMIAVSPGDFLSLVKFADYIFTDSFHVIAFSVNYNKQFFALKRSADSDQDSMNSRIYSLLELLGLKNRLLSGDEEYIDAGIIQYEGINTVLRNERERAFEFLRKFCR